MKLTRTAFDLSLLGAGQTTMMMTIKICLMSMGLMVISFGKPTDWSTLPIAIMLVGTAMGTIPAALSFHYLDRKRGHLLGIGLGLIGCALAAFAIMHKNFWLLSAGALLLGLFSGFGRYYSYTAADIVPHAQKPKAISYIIFAGVFSALIAPPLAERTEHLIVHHAFMATLIALLIINAVLGLIFMCGKFKALGHDSLATSAGLRTILTRRKFVVGTITTAVCYIVMSQVMVGTPLAMVKLYHISFAHTAFAMELHFLGMFAPALFTGRLIKRFGVPTFMLLGVALYVVCTWVLVTGTSVLHFDIGLFLLGVGWNFLFIAGSSLVAQSYQVSERNWAQGANNFITGLLSAAGALLAGPLLFHFGWVHLNLYVLPASAIILATAVWALVKKIT
jgi:MFS family permease